MVRKTIGTLAATLVLAAPGAGAAPVELDGVVPVAARVYAPAETPCGPAVNDRGDLAIVEASISPPDADGIARLEVAIRLVVGEGETVPPTRGAVFRDSDPWLTFDVLGVTSINNTCPDVAGGDCDRKCRTTGCDGGNGVCSCEPSADGTTSRCKCVSIHNRGFGIPARSGDRFRIVLDDRDDVPEDDECNNRIEVEVP